MSAKRSISFFFALLMAFLAVSVFAQEQEESTSPAPVQTESKPLSRNQMLMNKAAEVLDKVEASYPDFSKFLAQSDDKIISGFIKSLDDRIELLDKKNAVSSKEAASENLSFNAVEIPSKNLLYCRIDSFNPEALKQLSDDLKKTAEKDSKISSAVIDLRNCTGFKADCALNALRMLSENKKLPPSDSAKRVLKKPFAVLISDKTAGAAEVFASLTKDNSIALLVGTKTAGKPFEHKIVELYGDKALGLPVIPAFLDKKMNIKAVPPDIECKSVQLSYDKIAEKPDSISEDKAVSLASDILKSVSIINQN